MTSILIPLAVAVFSAGGPTFGSGRQQPAEPWAPEIAAPQYFAVLVENVDRSAAWYRAAFGLRDLGGSQAEDGSWQIRNVGNDALLVEIIRDDRARHVERARGFFKVGFHVSDVEAVAENVERSGGERPRIVEFERFGTRVLQLRDPDGNILQLSSRPRQ